MKKWGILLCILFLMMSSAAIAAVCGEITIGDSENCLKTDLCLYTDGNKYTGYFSILPGYVFQADALKEDCPPESCSEVIQDMSRILPDIFGKWFKMAGQKKQTGLFAGDLFDCACGKTVTEITWADLSLLMDVFESQDIPDSLVPLRNHILKAFRSWLPDAALVYPDICFQLEVYEEISAATLNILESGKTIGIISGQRTGDGKNLIIIGTAENGRTSYRQIEISTLKEKQIQIICTLMIDESGCGYRNLSENNTLLTETVYIDMTEPDRSDFLYTSRMGKEQSSFVSLEGSVLESENRRWNLNASFRYGEDKIPLAAVHFTNDLSSAVYPADSCKTVNLSDLNETDLSALGETIAELSQKWAVRLFQVLPAEFLLLWIN